MEIVINSTRRESGATAAREGASYIRKALEEKGEANIILATGASQFAVLEYLMDEGGIHWPSVSCFHLDEYVGLPITHGASFRRYLWERFVSKLPFPVHEFHWLNGELDSKAECQRMGKIIASREIDVAFVGIGENGHLAFNDPPADFDTEEPYLVVELDELCRKQQLGEGWFAALEQVPQKAISMSIKQIMKSKCIVCTVPEARKAQAVRDCVRGPVTNEVPASILQKHPDCHLYLDAESASLLRQS